MAEKDISENANTVLSEREIHLVLKTAEIINFLAYVRRNPDRFPDQEGRAATSISSQKCVSKAEIMHWQHENSLEGEDCKLTSEEFDIIISLLAVGTYQKKNSDIYYFGSLQ